MKQTRNTIHCLSVCLSMSVFVLYLTVVPRPSVSPLGSSTTVNSLESDLQMYCLSSLCFDVTITVSDTGKDKGLNGHTQTNKKESNKDKSKATLLLNGQTDRQTDTMQNKHQCCVYQEMLSRSRHQTDQSARS